MNECFFFFSSQYGAVLLERKYRDESRYNNGMLFFSRFCQVLLPLKNGEPTRFVLRFDGLFSMIRVPLRTGQPVSRNSFGDSAAFFAF